jgi:hypothetical protein
MQTGGGDQDSGTHVCHIRMARPGWPRGAPATCSSGQPTTSTRCLAPLKREFAWIYGRRTWMARNLLRLVIFDHVEGF